MKTEFMSLQGEHFTDIKGNFADSLEMYQFVIYTFTGAALL